MVKEKVIQGQMKADNLWQSAMSLSVLQDVACLQYVVLNRMLDYRFICFYFHVTPLVRTGAGPEKLAASSAAFGLLTGRFRVRESNLKEEMQVLQSDRRAGWAGVSRKLQRSQFKDFSRFPGPAKIGDCQLEGSNAHLNTRLRPDARGKRHSDEAAAYRAAMEKASGGSGLGKRQGPALKITLSGT